MNFNFNPNKIMEGMDGLSREQRKRIVDSVLEFGNGGVNMDEFLNSKGFLNDSVIRDKMVIQDLKEKFKSKLDNASPDEQEAMQEGKKMSDALEVIISDQVEMSNWFGPSAFSTKASEYDDFVNGVDSYIEFNADDGQGEIAFAIDASWKSDFSSLEKKTQRNMRKIRGEEVSMVKYFKSQIDDHKEKKRDIVPVVIGIEGENLDQLLALFSEIIKLRRKEGKNDTEKKVLREKMELIRTHPVQMIFLKEIKMQLDMYSKINIKEGFREKILRISKIIKEIIKDKEDEGIDLGGLKNDSIFDKIKDVVRKHTPK